MKKLLMAFGAIALLSGCATISKQEKHHIMFTSAPTNALVVFSDSVSCYTPCSRKLKRTQDLDATFSYGNQIKEVSLKSGFQKDTLRNTAGNAIMFGYVGIFFDIISGHNKGLDTNHVHVEF